ncbi:alpha-2-macroglobulin family protein [Cytophagaceae bacterium DM2B3-1]|uniref:Alpha-2-macroglobulin family protein n=1 Tax=Xanthocytophaga flava TaxID=3048013 RepID=A0ABT7CUV4_9BACT|nr:alpha-2-macroglobulin family protein [Xanthocytophaga flavus]MDJ1497549.1 alpha-2-macroglobulin family protein [Xanthocytophaga flavus]
MKTLFLLPFFVFLSFISIGQSLVHSRTTSFYTYVFQITNIEARTIYKKDLSSVTDKFFHTVIDSFQTAKAYTRILPQGHYLLAYASEDRLVYELKSVGQLQIKLLNNKNDLAIHLHDSLGNRISAANVFLKKRKIPFDTKTQSYRIRNTNRKGFLAIDYKGFTSYTSVTTQYGSNHLANTMRRVFLGRPGLGYITMPFYQVYASVRSGYPQGWIKDVTHLFDGNWWETNFSGFQRDVRVARRHQGLVIFNKPRYRAGDTVRLKAFIRRRRSGHPIHKELEAWLYKGHTQEKQIKLGIIQPYQPGLYEFSFILADSLRIKLGTTCQVIFKDKKEGEYVTGNFTYEDYELKSNTFTIRIDKKEYTTGEKIQLFAKGIDENELNVMDARVQLRLYPQSTGNFPQSQVIVPDTIWRQDQKLDATGETRIIVPDSIFPNATIQYQLDAAFLNSNNERHNHTLTFSRAYSSSTLKLSIQNDSLVADYLVAGKSQSHQAMLTLYANADEEGEIVHKDVSLPYKELVNPYTKTYSLEDSSQSVSLELQSQSSGFQVFTNRTIDSVSVQIVNPKHLPFWYTLHHKNKQLTSGQDHTDLQIKRKASLRQNYSASVQYIWNNKVYENEYEIPLANKQLQIETTQPATISPGQAIPIRVSVRDIKGKPVANADVTAYGITRKFTELRTPNIPDFSKRYHSRKIKNSFQLRNKFEGNQAETNRKLQWNRWHKEMGLDSLAYFQFLYPKNGIYKQYLSMPNLMTQIAPFVVIDGKIQQIHLLFIDEQPVYFQVADVGQRYSFHVDSGYHHIKIRTQTLQIDLDSVYLKPHHKLILSIDPQSFYKPKKGEKAEPFIRNTSTTLQKQTQIDTLKPYLSSTELAVLNQYLMPVKQNYYFGNDYVYIHQDKQIFTLHGPFQSRSSYFVGPVKPNLTHFVSKNSFSTDFIFEPSFEYDFQPQLLKMRTWTGFKDLFLANNNISKPNFAERAWTVEEIDSLTKAYQAVPSYPTEYYNNPNHTASGHGRLEIRHSQPDTKSKIIQYFVLYQDNNPSFFRIYPSYSQLMHNMEAGTYCMAILLDKNEYLLASPIYIQKNATTYYQPDWDAVLPADEYSNTLFEQIKKSIQVKIDLAYQLQDDKPVIKSYYPSQVSSEGFTHYVQGKILDETGSPLSGVSVSVKNSTRGTVSDTNGFYKLYVPADGILNFSFIGYMIEETSIRNRSVIDVQLVADVKALQEVVVIGYGTQQKKSITGAISTINQSLQGRIAGVIIKEDKRIRLRGLSSIPATQRPLIVIDGVPYDNLTDIDPALIASAEILQADMATGLYGARAANGVILITSKPNSILPKPNDSPFPEITTIPAENAIRSRFSDYAFWEPQLTTDKKGEVSFTATFPDDITNWRTFFVVMGNKKQTGFSESSVKAFKSLAATLSVPRFLIQGDSTQVIGKSLNYTPDTIALQTSFEVNTKIQSRKQIQAINATVDSLILSATTSDSLQIKYYLQKPDGYTDGEMRSIPIFPVGITETKGQFWNLERDTTVQLRFDTTLGKVKIYARAQVLDILLDEIEHLHRYEYLCNEQIASKIKAYLASKRICNQLHKSFAFDQDIQKLIRKLEQTQLKEGAWSWWKEGPVAVWVTTHTTEALLDAQTAGYTVSFNRQNLINYFTYQLEKEKVSFDDQIRMLQILKRLQANSNFTKYITGLDIFFIPKKESIVKNKLGYQKVIEEPKPSLYQYLQRMALRQQFGLAYSTDTLFRIRQQTLFGSSYWGEVQYHPYLNEIQTTLLVYRILKVQGGHEAELSRIRNYFFEKRATGYWRNTYESSQIIETILADVLGSDTTIQKSQLIVKNGSESKTITSFPFETEVAAKDILRIQKSGTLPVYLTSYQQFHNASPTKVEKDFIIKTSFKGTGLTQQVLKQGDQITLHVSVNVTKDADYVLVEVPIPAGCSYSDESQKSWAQNWYETYREPFRQKTSIYCTKLNKGRYTFDIQLVARYAGAYTLNPAKAELMYFPTFFGRNELTKIRIK